MSKDKSAKKDRKEKKASPIEDPVADPAAKVSKKDRKDKKEKKATKDAAATLLENLARKEEAADGGVSEEEDEPMSGTADAPVMPSAIAANDDASLLVPFAQPLAADKVAKKLYKTTKKGLWPRLCISVLASTANYCLWHVFTAARNKCLKRGVKEVVKALRKSSTTAGSSALVILAADISPMDVISHIPVLCEDHDIPYIFVRSRAELGAAGATKRPTSVVMIVPGSGSKDKKKKKKSKDGEETEADAKEEKEDGFKEAYDEAVKLVKAAL